MRTEKRLGMIGEKVVFVFATPFFERDYRNDDVGIITSTDMINQVSYVRIERTGKIHMTHLQEYRVIVEESAVESVGEAYLIYAPARPILLTPSKHVEGMYFNHDSGDFFNKEQVDYMIRRFAQFGCAIIPVTVKEMYAID